MSDFTSKIEVKTIESNDKRNIIDSVWLINNIPWMNHDNKIGHVVFDSSQEIMYSHDGNEIRTIVFDSVSISALHSFGGTSYAYHFKNGDEAADVINDTVFIGFSRDEIVEKAKAKYKSDLKRNIKAANEAIKNILKLEEPKPSQAILDYIDNLEEWEELNDSESAIVKSVIETENIKPFKTSSSLHVWEERYRVDDDTIRYIGGIGLEGFSVERLKKKGDE